ncbi:MAG: hypothetical protein SCALA702_27990 [Melioribacteraceae bacterium]|nr:MAG: hypothetical protein SCALA702_27990 [Melioribacteraceae bacterium]
MVTGHPFRCKKAPGLRELEIVEKPVCLFSGLLTPTVHWFKGGSHSANGGFCHGDDRKSQKME